jgi:pilus assembly protein CpaF
MVSAPTPIFVRRHRGSSGYHDDVFHHDDHVVRTLTKLLDDASTAHRSIEVLPMRALSREVNASA